MTQAQREPPLLNFRLRRNSGKEPSGPAEHAILAQAGRQSFPTTRVNLPPCVTPYGKKIVDLFQQNGS